MALTVNMTMCYLKRFIIVNTLAKVTAIALLISPLKKLENKNIVNCFQLSSNHFEDNKKQLIA